VSERIGRGLNLRQLLPGSRRPVDRDELGGSEDGGLAIINSAGTLHVTSSRTASALRFLLARVQTGGQPIPGRIALTSALRGEGVTFITRSLASIIAYDTEASVAIVDLNWELPKSGKPRRRRRKRTPEETRPTLADAVEHDASIDEIIETTTNPRLSLVSAGPLPLARRPGVAGGRALERVVDELGTRFDHLLFDLPPVLASSDAIQLAQLSHVYALVVLQGVTPESQIEAATRELTGVTPLGVILNGFDSKVPQFLRRVVEA
jgi:Mrp family chromosome partitioning ATPase